MVTRKCLGYVLLVLAATVAGEGYLSAQEDLVSLGSCKSMNPKCEEEELASIRVPPGTETWSPSKGNLQFKVPDGYVVWTRQADGSITKLLESDVTCSCAEGDCSPVDRSGTIYCLVGPKCTSCCKRSTSALAVTLEHGRVDWATREERRTLPLAGHVLMEIPEIQAAVRKFMRQVYGGKLPIPLMTKGREGVAPNGYALVSINVYGYLAKALVPQETAALKCEEELINGTALDVADCDASKESCKCNTGTSGCTHWSSFGISGCDAGACTSCTMSIK